MYEHVKTVLITGTSSGIGMFTAVRAAAHGWRTIATMRDTTRSQALQDQVHRIGADVDIRELDVTSDASVADAVRGVLSDYGRLDAVVNNAGSAFVGTVENTELSTYQDSLEVNYLGPVRLIKAAMPALRASLGRIVTVSSVGGVIGQPFNEAYCAAKFAIEGFLEALHPVAATVGVDVTVIEPGAVSSSFLTNAGLNPQAMVKTS